MLVLVLFLSWWPPLPCETIQEVDSLVLVKHHVNLHRFKEHVLAWGEDQGVGVFRSEMMNPLMSHLTVEVAMLASTLMEHMHLENVEKAVPTTPSSIIQPDDLVIPSRGRNGIGRVQRNIFGDIVSTITGMPTGEQYQHHMHVQEEIRKKLIHMAKHQVEAEKTVMKSITDLMTAEELHGRLDNFGQMAPFLQAYKRPLNDYLASFEENYNILLPVPKELIEDLRVWAAMAISATNWQPIEHQLRRPPEDSLKFVSDAAGGTGNEKWAGVASLGLTDDGGYWFLCTGKWPPVVLTEKDEKGAALASKTTMLETIGLLLPLLMAPDEVRGRNGILGVDNIAVYFAWENRSSKGDKLSSCLIRALHVVSAYLECRVFVEHIPRCSTKASSLADSLTRESSATMECWDKVKATRREYIPDTLMDWLKDPKVDWNLGIKLIRDI